MLPLIGTKGLWPEVKLRLIENFKVMSIDLCEKLCKNVKFSFKYSQEKEIKDVNTKYPSGIFPVSSNGMIGGAFVSSFDIIENQSLVICTNKRYGLHGFI